ncbi:MAG: nicotinate phosphoribosyltransferase [Balneolales bacterium]
MIEYTATYTDQYQLTMAQVYYLKGHKEERAVFDYFFRKLPFNGGYAVFAGLEDLLSVLENLRFSDEDMEYLHSLDFDPEFLDYLKTFKFKGNIYSSREGDLIFPTRPVLQVEANIIEAQIIETLLLNILNFQTLIATKANRMRFTAGTRKLLDFGLRRAQGPGGYYASRAAVIGGFDSTSNVKAGLDYDIPVSGTMAHSFIQSYDDELEAFRHFAEQWPKNCVLLVDTYDTLNSGVSNAITVAREMKSRGEQLKAIRLDSGDLAYLSKQSRSMLDEAGFEHVKIAASNQIDEHIIKSLLDQKAPIDLFGIGTSLVTGKPDAALDGVYKLAFSRGKPRIKLSENITKTTLPHLKQVFRILADKQSMFGAEVITMADENKVQNMHHPFEPYKSLSLEGFIQEPLLHKVMENGVTVHTPRTLQEIASYSQAQLKKLPEEFKRFEYPHVYKIGISDSLKNERDKLIAYYKK